MIDRRLELSYRGTPEAVFVSENPFDFLGEPSVEFLRAKVRDFADRNGYLPLDPVGIIIAALNAGNVITARNLLKPVESWLIEDFAAGRSLLDPVYLLNKARIEGCRIQVARNYN